MDYSPYLEAVRPWQLAFTANEVWSCPSCEQFLPLLTEWPEWCGYCNIELHQSLPHDITQSAARVRVSVRASDAHLIQRKSAVALRPWYGWSPREYFCEPLEIPDIVYELYPHWKDEELIPLLTLGSREDILKNIRSQEVRGGYLLRAFVSELDVSDWVSEDLGGNFPSFECDLPDFPQFTGVTRFVSRHVAPGRVLLRAAPTCIEVEDFFELDSAVPGKLVESPIAL